MKTQLFQKTILTTLIVVMGISLFAQEDIIFDPALLEPADTGYYIGGAWKDEDGDQILEFYNGCYDAYGDADHREADVQLGFTYNKAMVMPTCWPKDAINDHSLAEIDHPEGYIELTKSKYPNTDSASVGYIITPSLTNLVSLTMETSPDASASDARHIMWWIDYSKDNGATWEEDIYIEDETLSKLGDEHVYNSDSHLQFDEMINASKASPILLRIMSKPQNATYASQRLKVHYIKIVTEKGTSTINNPIINDLSIRLVDKSIYTEKGEIVVFNTLGQEMGRGKSVTVKSGVYIVRTDTGATQKILVR